MQESYRSDSAGMVRIAERMIDSASETEINSLILFSTEEGDNNVGGRVERSGKLCGLCTRARPDSLFPTISAFSAP